MVVISECWRDLLPITCAFQSIKILNVILFFWYNMPLHIQILNSMSTVFVIIFIIVFVSPGQSFTDVLSHMIFFLWLIFNVLKYFRRGPNIYWDGPVFRWGRIYKQLNRVYSLVHGPVSWSASKNARGTRPCSW